MELSATTKLAIKEHKTMVEETLRLIAEYQLTNFDRLEFKRAIRDTKKIAEISRDLSQRIFGPELRAKNIKTLYSLTKKLAQVSLHQFALYVEATEASSMQIQTALLSKVEAFVVSLLEETEDDLT